ncbi:diguanylate cyclase domain-containing protein [Pseudomonas sp. W5-01]|uniref:GGDEF domain-containing response regulator n=1 Tax=Pseudomonas sp. W5-01 TaxID=3097454 RepID=UPI00397C10F0
MHELTLEHLYLIEDDPRILIVDQAPMIQKTIKSALESSKEFHIASCMSASDIFKEIEDFKPSVILLGKLSENVVELDILQSLRRKGSTSDIPVVVMATTDSSECKSKCFSNGASDYIIKLPDNAELIARIKYHSGAYFKGIQLDEAYRALRVSQQQLLDTNLTLQRLMNDLQISNERLQILANFDGLTGIANRASFDRFVKRYWETADHAHSEISLLMIDVDHFKKFNDAFGHVEGDNALVQVAKVLTSASVKEASLVARYGGEEFCVVLPNIGSDRALEIANDLLKSMQAVGIPHIYPTPTSVVTLSIGIATSTPTLLESPKELLQKADAALYLGKTTGRNQANIAH